MLIEKPSRLGLSLRLGKMQFFFGNRDASLANLRTEYPRLRFSSVHQVHGAKLVEANPSQAEIPADSHYTLQKNLALAIKTADCLPVFLLYKNIPDIVVGIHAGWRGVQQKIVTSCHQQILKSYPQASLASALIGPHIQESSFEVGEEVVAQLGQAFSDLPQSSFVNRGLSKKPHVNLANLVVHELSRAGLGHEKIYRSPLDTFSDLTHHSFRRDSQNAGRQISFCVIEE